MTFDAFLQVRVSPPLVGLDAGGCTKRIVANVRVKKPFGFPADCAHARRKEKNNLLQFDRQIRDCGPRRRAP